MTEQNQARALLATLRDALQQLEFNLELTRSGGTGGDQAERIRTAWQRCATCAA